MLSFNKRINGKTYYLRVGLSLVGVLAFALSIDSLPDDSSLKLVGILCFIFVGLFWQLFVLSQIRQRANDIGTHPLIITIVAWCTPLLLVLGFIPGQKQTNKYGPVPN